ncbi:MAG: glycosyltransferase [Chloroflexi bacterium]|nr:MAG: glycosyltransferase [Chloroflexota bacterium]
MAELLILTPQLPYPPQQGTSLRNYHIIKGLAPRHQITLLSFLEEGQTLDKAAPLQALCRQIVTVPVVQRSIGDRLRQLVTSQLPDMAHRLYTPVFAEQLRELLQQNSFDVVQIEGIELVRYMAIVREVSPQSRLVFDDHNVETELQRRNFWVDVCRPHRWVAALYSAVQMGRLGRFEQWACEMADAVTTVSEADREQLGGLFPELVTPITAVPNCIDITFYEPSSLPETADLPRYDLVFIGKMDYRPNIDAVRWFAEAVWPQVLAVRPETTWAIVGQKPHPAVIRLGEQSGITVTGWVEDIRPYLLGAEVFIMPFRVGSGTRLKLIEALAAGKAIVSTRVGAEGFPIRDGQDLVLADSAEEMATAVLHLLHNTEARTRLGENGRILARRYDWREIIPLFDDIYRSIGVFA